ncbi:hypothetical protein BDY19DRAFT_969270 [Irpex rosettiformis]|uniref:Uncharacterized protein n=1 Tax=Irpex rosettiformis TaxID=378272 RepID=A0ACB8TRX5_9APHY|nr:hypothetical protein BDY19DRAFT_969270 [Irpex rosettiformis]
MAATAACRILVVSSTTDTAHQFVQRIKALSTPVASEGEPSHSLSDVTSLAQASSGELSELHAKLTNTEPATSIPWTISNKYYTADVHFELRSLDGFAGYLASDVPAVVYVWDRRDQHKTDVPELAKKLEHYDPEVSLAVRFAPSSKDLHPHNHEEEGEDGLDEFISSHGFEYVDGEHGPRIPTQDGSNFSDEDHAGVPGLPRVIDALSTIMWPSLVQTQRTSSRRKSRGGDLLDWASMEDVSGTGGGALLFNNRDATPSQMKLKKEMDELESWLQADLDAGQGPEAKRKAHDDPWSTAHGREIDGYHGFDGDTEHTFEDDFDDFVGAPMDVTYDDSRSPRDTGTRYPASLTIAPSQFAVPAFAHTSIAAPQRTFTSDFVTFRGEVVHPEDEEDRTLDFNGDENDPDMPSRAEVEEMSRHLFGAGLGIPPSSPTWQRLHSPARGNSKDLPSGENTGASGSQPQGPEDFKFERLDGGDDGDDDFELGAFDLSKVLGALQGMKEQIASMDDEDERKRAAAKVALGFVYGLQKEEELDKERGEGQA